MKKFFLIALFVPCLAFMDEGMQPTNPEPSDFSEELLVTKRHKLKITNWTNLDPDSWVKEDNLGRYLKLVWKRDVHQPPQVTHLLPFNATDERTSRGIGRGRNSRHFEVEVYREYFGDVKYVGTFTETIVDTDGNSDERQVHIRKDFTADSVRLWKCCYKGEAGWEWEFIGSLPRDQWPL